MFKGNSGLVGNIVKFTHHNMIHSVMTTSSIIYYQTIAGDELFCDMLAESTGMTDKNIQQRVVDTIRGGDCELLREIIESDMIPVNSELYNGQTPLGMAISLHKVYRYHHV